MSVPHDPYVEQYRSPLVSVRDSATQKLVHFLRNYGPRKHPRLTVTVLLWLFGISVFFLPAPVRITPEMSEYFEAKLLEADKDADERALALERLMEAEMDTDNTKVGALRCHYPYIVSRGNSFAGCSSNT
jgi:hypothetical protein